MGSTFLKAWAPRLVSLFPVSSRGAGGNPVCEEGKPEEGRAPLDRVGQTPAKKTAQNGAWRATKIGDYTVNTSPEAERAAGKYLEIMTPTSWSHVSKT